MRNILWERKETYYVPQWHMKKVCNDYKRPEALWVAFPLNYMVSFALWLEFKWQVFRHKPTWIDKKVRQLTEERLNEINKRRWYL